MKILVFSDSHSDVRKMKEALNIHKNTCEAVIFLGDGLKDIRYLKPMYPEIAFFEVKGNCDFFEDADTENVVNLDGIRVLIAHGHTYGVKGGYGSIAIRAEKVGADAAFFGHTHRPTEEAYKINGKTIRLFNPGSIGKGGTYGVVNTSGKVLITGHGKIL